MNRRTLLGLSLCAVVKSEAPKPRSWFEFLRVEMDRCNVRLIVTTTSRTVTLRPSSAPLPHPYQVLRISRAT